MGELFQMDDYHMFFGNQEIDMDVAKEINNKLWELMLQGEKPEQNELCKMYKQHVNACTVVHALA